MTWWPLAPPWQVKEQEGKESKLSQVEVYTTVTTVLRNITKSLPDLRSTMEQHYKITARSSEHYGALQFWTVCDMGCRAGAAKNAKSKNMCFIKAS